MTGFKTNNNKKLAKVMVICCIFLEIKPAKLQFCRLSVHAGSSVVCITNIQYNYRLFSGSKHESYRCRKTLATMQCIHNIPCVCVLQPQGRWDKADPDLLAEPTNPHFCYQHLLYLVNCCLPVRLLKIKTCLPATA